MENLTYTYKSINFLLNFFLYFREQLKPKTTLKSIHPDGLSLELRRHEIALKLDKILIFINLRSR